MSVAQPSLNEDVRANSILTKLDADPAAPESAPEPVNETPAPEAEVTAPVETPASGEEQARPEPVETPAIEPPPFLKAEYKTRWKELPTDWQRYLAQQEEENSRTVSTKLEEAATRARQAETARKAAEDRAAAVVQEQQRYAQTLNQLATERETLDPVISEYRKTDLVKLAQEDPARYTQLRASYDDRMQKLDAVRQEQWRVENIALQTHFQREEKALAEKVPEWNDIQAGKKAIDDLKSYVVKTYGYRAEEVATIADHRLVLMARDAAAYNDLKAKYAALESSHAEELAKAKKSIAEKRVIPEQRVIRPNAANETGERSASDRSKALIKQARGKKNISDKASLIAEALE